MSTNDPEFYQAPKFTPEPPQAPLPKQRGCFFYGCIIASILAVLFVILMGVIGFFGYRFLNQMVEQYTSVTPQQLPKVEMPADKLQALKDRVAAFRKAVDAGTPTEPLVLTSDDLNALIEENADFKGTVYVKIEGDEINGQISFPLDKMQIGMVKGRYLNGEAKLKASLSNGVLIVILDSIEVNGKRPPDEMMKGIREQNLAKDVYKDPEGAERIRKLESLEVKDGKIIIKARAKAEADPVPTKTQGKAAPPADAATKTEVPAKAEPPKLEDSPKTKAQPPAVESATPKP